MIYVPIVKSEAPRLSKAIFDLHRPPHVRQPGEVTEYYCAWYDHPTIDFAVLELPETENIPLHLEADASELQSILAPFVLAGSLAQEELDGLVLAVSSAAGSTVTVADLIPPSWQQYILTRQEAEMTGYIPVVEE